MIDFFLLFGYIGDDAQGNIRFGFMPAADVPVVISMTACDTVYFHKAFGRIVELYFAPDSRGICRRVHDRALWNYADFECSNARKIASINQEKEKRTALLNEVLRVALETIREIDKYLQRGGKRRYVRRFHICSIFSAGVKSRGDDSAVFFDE